MLLFRDNTFLSRILPNYNQHDWRLIEVINEKNIEDVICYHLINFLLDSTYFENDTKKINF